MRHINFQNEKKNLNQPHCIDVISLEKKTITPLFTTEEK